MRLIGKRSLVKDIEAQVAMTTDNHSLRESLHKVRGEMMIHNGHKLILIGEGALILLCYTTTIRSVDRSTS